MAWPDMNIQTETHTHTHTLILTECRKKRNAHERWGNFVNIFHCKPAICISAAFSNHHASRMRPYISKSMLAQSDTIYDGGPFLDGFGSVIEVSKIFFYMALFVGDNANSVDNNNNNMFDTSRCAQSVASETNETGEMGETAETTRTVSRDVRIKVKQVKRFTSFSHHLSKTIGIFNRILVSVLFFLLSLNTQSYWHTDNSHRMLCYRLSLVSVLVRCCFNDALCGCVCVSVRGVLACRALFISFLHFLPFNSLYHLIERNINHRHYWRGWHLAHTPSEHCRSYKKKLKFIRTWFSGRNERMATILIGVAHGPQSFT